MYRTKELLWQDFQSAVRRLKSFSDAYMNVFYHLILERWKGNQTIKDQAKKLINENRPELAADLFQNGPMTIAVRAKMNKV